MPTLAPSDSPDWTSIPGGLRYLGSIDASGTGPIAASLVVAPTSYDYSLVIIPVGSPASTTSLATITVINTTGNVITDSWSYAADGKGTNSPFVAFIAAAIPGSWEVRAAIDSASGSTWTLYVFAAPALQVQRVVAGGRGLLVLQNGIGPRRPYDQQSQATPAAAAQASITFPAVAGAQWIIDHAHWRLVGRGTADLKSAQITDGGTIIAATRLQVTATVGSTDEWKIGPEAGVPISVNAIGKVEFSAAAAALNFETVTAGGYLYVPPV